MDERYQESMVEMDDGGLRAEVIGMLSVLEVVDLLSVAQRFSLEVPIPMTGNRDFILKLILKYLTSDELDRLSDQGRGIYRDLRDAVRRYLNPMIPTQASFGTTFIKEKNPTFHRYTSTPSTYQNKFNENKFQSDPYEMVDFDNMSQGSQNFGNSIKSNNPFVENNTTKSCNPFANNLTNYQQTFPNPFNCKLREFKISGSIGSVGQKDKLSYTSLAFQINNGLKQGYSENDIISSVIKSINPGNSLRSYLESRHEINVKQLLKILRSHFKEKNATSLFTELTNAAQKPEESAQEFVMRLMSLRQKVVLVSTEEQCPYDEHLVQTRFLHAVMTGLRNENVRHELKPCLKTPNISDEEILSKLTEAVAEENEHQGKVATGKRTANVCSVIDDSSKKEECSKLRAEVTELKVKLERLSCAQRDLEKLKESFGHNLNEPEKTVRFRCDECVKSNNRNRCYHCFHCGLTDHMSYQCPNRYQSGSSSDHYRNLGSNKSFANGESQPQGGTVSPKN